MPSSLLMDVQATPQVEPLPTYRSDPETSSIRSSAPSYVSEAPTYHTQVPDTHHRVNFDGSHGVGLPPTSYAPGFHRAPSYGKNDLTHLSFNISEWSSAKNGPQARHYQNVANRRAKLASIEEQARLTNLAPTMAFQLSAVTSTEAPGFSVELNNSSQNQQAAASTTSPEPLLPLEDPELVGVAAANAARERRLYMTKCLNESGALRQENKNWDFMLGQMTDWQEREKSWDGFKKNVEGRNLLGNKFLRRLMP